MGSQEGLCYVTRDVQSTVYINGVVRDVSGRRMEGGIWMWSDGMAEGGAV